MATSSGVLLRAPPQKGEPMTPLVIMIHGLIALVPMSTASGVDHMTALMVNALSQPGDMDQCFARHTPILEFPITDTGGASCIEAGCTVNVDTCQCDFSKTPRKQVELAITPPLSTVPHAPFNPAPQSALPFDSNAAADLAYLVNLSRPPLNGKLNPDVLSADPAKVPNAVIARMYFPFDSVTPCSLAVSSDEGSDQVHTLAFRPNHGDEKAGELEQALAQRAVASVNIPDGAQVAVKISDFDGTNAHLVALVTTLNIINNKPEYMIMIHDDRDSLAIDDACENGVGRDFAFFYDLTLSPPSWKDRPVPHVKYGHWKSARDVEVTFCSEHPKAMTSRPICAMAIINN
jgi:hypothetical protein